MARLTVEQRVANGCRWLDENFPGWVNRIKTGTLNLCDAEQCICGQLFAKKADPDGEDSSGYSYAVNNLFGEANSWITAIVRSNPRKRPPDLYGRGSVAYSRRAEKVSTALGFDGAEGEQEEWLRVIAERRRQIREAKKASA